MGMQRYRVSSQSLLVRAAAPLSSAEIQRLPAHTVVTVAEKITIPDEDATPRWRIEQPVAGFVTPYLASADVWLLEELHDVASTERGPARKAVWQLVQELRRNPLVRKVRIPSSTSEAGGGIEVLVDGDRAQMFISSGGWGRSEKLCISYNDGRPLWQTKYFFAPDNGRLQWGNREECKQIYVWTDRAQALDKEVHRACTWGVSRLLFLAARDPHSWLCG